MINIIINRRVKKIQEIKVSLEIKIIIKILNQNKKQIIVI